MRAANFDSGSLVEHFATARAVPLREAKSMTSVSGPALLAQQRKLCLLQSCIDFQINEVVHALPRPRAWPHRHQALPLLEH